VIPASQLDPRILQSLTDYVRTEITQALNDRQRLEEVWAKYELAYKVEPEKQTKDFPFKGAANLVLPVIATDVDTVYSRLMGTLFAQENIWTCRALNSAMVPFAPRLQEFLQWAQNNELGVYDAVADWLLEVTKLGTGILKQRYTRQTRKVYQWRETDYGITQQHIMLMTKNNPVLQHVALVDFLVPATATTITDAPWCAERLNLTWGQLQERIRAGIYQGGQNIANWWARDRGSKLDQIKQAMDRFEPAYGDKFEVWECWLDYDIHGGGQPCAIVFTIHLPTMTVLRVDYNPFFNQEKPYSTARYLRQNKRFYGIGLAEMLFQFQEEISAMHNQRLDNATLANSSMFKARKNIGIKQNEPVIPGRWFLLDNLDDVQPMVMGQRYDSTVPYENMTLSYAGRRTGVNDYIMGNNEPNVGYAALGTNVMQHKEAGKRFDQVLRECRICMGESGTRIAELYQQFDQHGKEYLAMGAEDGELVHQILQFPLELIRNGVSIELTATSATANKEIEVRTNTLVMQMLMQFYQQIMQALSYVVNPQIPPPIQQAAAQMVRGGTVMMRRLLDNYGVQDIDNLVPALEDATASAGQQLNSLLSLASGVQRGMAGPNGISGLPPGDATGPAGVPALIGAPATNGAGPYPTPPAAGTAPSNGMGLGAPPAFPPARPY